MTDRKKVISGLMHHREKYSLRCAGTHGDLCPYYIDQDECVRKLCDDVLELLKEQEPVKPVDKRDRGFYYACGSCGKPLGIVLPSYCQYCGRKVKRSG